MCLLIESHYFSIAAITSPWYCQDNKTFAHLLLVHCFAGLRVPYHRKTPQSTELSRDSMASSAFANRAGLANTQTDNRNNGARRLLHVARSHPASLQHVVQVRTDVLPACEALRLLLHIWHAVPLCLLVVQPQYVSALPRKHAFAGQWSSTSCCSCACCE